MRHFFCAALIVSLASVIASAQSPSLQDDSTDDETTPEVKYNVEFGRELTNKIRVGVRVTAGGPCRGMIISLPVPKDWPEQQVKMIEEDVSNNVRKLEYRELENSVKQLVAIIPRLDAGEEAYALVTYEVRGHAIIGPDDTKNLVAPKPVPKELSKFLKASPQIESRNRTIQTETKQLVKDIETEWEKASAIYEFVRSKVTYRESELKGAVESLKDGVADCEGMTSLFIAMCRAANIPARMVWVTDHCYPEFYLEDEQKNGQWYPCQVAGTHSFGSMPDIRPILQKGDNIRIPEKRGGQRYAALHLKAKAVKKPNPKVVEVMEFVTD
ncbi:MAG: transglutaminase domain-containing protein [Planctomycetales bacterium]|nr:transglutaminase domain-containing protein [Planctomycetales bacterium]